MHSKDFNKYYKAYTLMKLANNIKKLKQYKYKDSKNISNILKEILNLNIKKISEKVLLRNLCNKYQLNLNKFLEFLKKEDIIYIDWVKYKDKLKEELFTVNVIKRNFR